MEDKSLEVKKAVYIRPNPTCPKCMKVLPYQVNIDSIESQDVGWVLHGVGKHKTSKVLCRCPNCGAMYQTLLYAIPIECASFPCPKCHQLQNLEFKVHHIQVEKDYFEFEAEISCKKCGNKKSLKKALKKVMDVLKITVGPNGVTVSKA